MHGTQHNVTFFLMSILRQRQHGRIFISSHHIHILCHHRCSHLSQMLMRCVHNAHSTHHMCVCVQCMRSAVETWININRRQNNILCLSLGYEHNLPWQRRNCVRAREHTVHVTHEIYYKIKGIIVFIYLVAHNGNSEDQPHYQYTSNNVLQWQWRWRRFQTIFFGFQIEEPTHRQNFIYIFYDIRAVFCLLMYDAECVEY